MDQDTYERFLNINTLNSKNIKECARLYALSDEKKQVLTWEQYTFEEIRLFATVDIGYIKLYHCLAGLKIDDRLRVIREIAGRNCLPKDLSEEQMDKLGIMLKRKSVSRWLSEELGHVEQISYEQTVRLLSVWDEVCRFIPEIQTGHHADFLLYSLKELHNLPDFRTAMERMLEIFRAFLSGALETEKEKARWLCIAEIAGRFHEVKYHKNDLEQEIALQIMQIGEALGHTCLSYRDGGYKRCLLSCFDTNKRVLYLSLDGTLVFRAIARLTKGAFRRMQGEYRGLEFADLTREEAEANAENKRKEYLTLFLECPYFKGISEDKEREVIRLVLEMLKKKAKQLQATLILSDTYHKFLMEGKQFIRAKYYMYISASKNGEQYLDSLGGMADASREGSYEKGYFLLPESLINPKTEKEKRQEGIV